MAKRPTITPVQVGDASAAINANFNRIAAQFDLVFSRDGAGPNQLTADLDANSNDLLNVKALDTESLKVGGQDIYDLLAASSDAAAAAALAQEAMDEVNALSAEVNSPDFVTDLRVASVEVPEDGIKGAKLAVRLANENFPTPPTIWRRVSDKLSDIISPRDFGAAGDGITDDTAAIQAMIDFFASTAWGSSFIGDKKTVDFSGRDYLISAPVIVQGPTNQRVNLKFTNGRLVAATTFPIGLPMVLIGSYGAATNFEYFEIDCNFRAAGIGTYGGGGSSAHCRIQNTSIRRYKRFGIAVGSIALTLQAGHSVTPMKWIVGGTSGATALVTEVTGNVARVICSRRNLATGSAFVGGEVISIDASPVGTIDTIGNVGSCQTHLIMNLIAQLGSGEPGYWDPTTPLDPGIILNTNDCKVHNNIVTRCHPSIVVDGSLNIFSGNHSFPTAAGWAATTLQFTNYEVWGGGNQFVANYIDNGFIDLHCGNARTSLICSNTFMFVGVDNNGNDACVRFIAHGANVSLSGVSIIDDNISTGGGESNVLSFIKYIETDGTFAGKWSDAGRLFSKGMKVANGPHVFAAMRETISTVGAFTTANANSRVAFYDTSGVANPPMFGSSGGALAMWNNNTLVAKYDDALSGFDLQGKSVLNSRIRPRFVTANTALDGTYLSQMVRVGSNSVTITLPDSSTMVEGANVYVSSLNTGCTVAPFGTNLIEGANTPVAVNQWTVKQFVYIGGNNWSVV